MAAAVSRAPRAIEKAIATAVKHAEWLTDSDQAAVRLAKRLGETMDNLYATDEGRLLVGADERASKTTYTAQTLLRVLEQLGLTATSRAALGYAARPDEDDPLAKIRDAMADVIPLANDG